MHIFLYVIYIYSVLKYSHGLIPLNSNTVSVAALHFQFSPTSAPTGTSTFPVADAALEQGCCKGSSAEGWTGGSRYSVPPGFLESCTFAVGQRACPAPSLGSPGSCSCPSPLTSGKGVSPVLAPPGHWAVMQECSGAGRHQDRKGHLLAAPKEQLSCCCPTI